MRTKALTTLLVAASIAGCGGGRYYDSYGAAAAPPPSPVVVSSRAGDVGGGEAMGGEHYEAEPENPTMDTAQETMATFSLDVDTASYTIMRRDLRGGRLPNPASVRVEEYLNFFDADEPAPPPGSDTPFAVHLESAPAPLASGERLLRIGVRAADVAGANRPRANVVFLVDVSGSMNTEDKLGLVQYSLNVLLDSLRDDDHIALVVYAGRDAVLVPPTEVQNRTAILDAIYGLRAGGSTNGAAGIRTAYDLAAQHFNEGGINRVVLCTDGDFNVGLSGDPLLQHIAQQRQRGITLSVLGFGSGNINDHQMEQLADRGNGNYAYIDSRQEAMRVLSRDLAGTLQVVAQDVKVQVEVNRDVVARFRLVGYENRVLDHQDFEDDTVDAAEVGSGDFVTAYIAYELQPNVTVDDPRRLAEVRVRFKRPGGQASELRTFETSVADGHARFEDASTSFRFGAAVAGFADVLRESPRASVEDLDDIERIAQGAVGQSSDRAELVQLVRAAREIYAQQR